MSEKKQARRILETLKEYKELSCLREIAKRAGFCGANSKEFKAGLRYLIREGILKLHQSGWPSEHRGGHNHSKGIILMGDIYEVGGVELNLEKLNCSDDFRDIGKGLDLPIATQEESKDLYSFLRKISACSDCKNKPVVYLTSKEVPLCEKHWERLSNSRIEWSSDVKKSK